jgi:hypothetical protein
VCRSLINVSALWIAVAASVAAAAEPPGAAPSEPKATGEQLALLDAALLESKPTKPQQSALDRIGNAVREPANEGLAVEVVRRAGVLYDADPNDRRARALVMYLSYRAIRDQKLHIDGPYLQPLAELLRRIVEQELTLEAGWGLHVDYRPLIAYLGKYPNDPLRERILPTARKYAKVPDPPPAGDTVAFLDSAEAHRVWNRTRFAWQTLFALGVLHDGIELTEATKLLGKPDRQTRNIETAVWRVPTQFRISTHLYAEVRDGKCYGFQGHH